MYTVMIVEDEVFVSLGLKNMIRWSDMGMTVIGEARNGKEGLEMYEQMKPDLILTDIKMPVMNGIDMITQIREKDATTKIVVLSCHEDYELVRQAFKQGISDYILKVKMMPDDIERIIRKIYDELQSESAKKGNCAFGDNWMALRNEQLDKCKAYIISQSISEEEFRTFAGELQIPEEGLAIGIMEIHSNAERQNAEEKRKLALELIQKLLSEEKRGFIFRENEHRYLLLFSFPGTCNVNEYERPVDELLQRISDIIRTYLNGNSVFGISSFADAYHQLGRLYTEALETEKAAILLGEAVTYYGREDCTQKYKNLLTAFEERITQADWLTDVCRRKILKECSFQKDIVNNDIETMKEVFRRWIHRISFDNAVQKGETLLLAVEVSKQMRYAVSLPELIRTFEQYMSMLSDVKESNLVSAEVARAVNLVKERFYEEDFGLAEVADYVGMNKQYFSSLFKKEVGQGFSDYLNSVRINKACELLRNTDLKSYEISEVIGFQDESYFSRVFKKVIGVRPNEYRRAELDLEEPKDEGWL